MISQNTIQQILSRIDIVEIVGGFVKLKKRGTNYLGLCPFHNEKTPSFTVSPAKEIYKCFGCGRSGNAIGFIMEHEKYSYVEALRWLANKYNVEVEETQVSNEQREQQQLADALYIINSFAQKNFAEQLFNTEEGQDVGLSYLKERGFREDVIKKFQLGYCSENGQSFAQPAINAQYNSDYLLRTGLVVNRNDRLVDNYRGRVIFPVHNNTGKVIGFGARIIKSNDKAPKYINTPENEIYIKSKILYGSFFARMAIDKADECLLVEGYTDVISLHQNGIENVVASGGTSLTTDQLRLIKKYTNNLTIIYDGDAAGVKAALRGLDMALEEGLNVRLVLIPDNDDPDSYVNKVGSSAFLDFIKNDKKDFILFQLEVALKDAGNDTIRKSAVVNQIAETLSKINKTEDFTKQQDYIRQCAEILKIEESGLHALVNKFIREKISKQEQRLPLEEAAFFEKQASGTPDNETIGLLTKDEIQEKAVVRALLEFGLKPWDEEKRVADYILEEIDGLMHDGYIDNPDIQNIISEYRYLYQQGTEPTNKNFVYHSNSAISSLSVSILAMPHEVSPNWKDHYDGKIFTREELYKEEVFSSVNYLLLRKIKRMIDENQKDLEKEPNKDQQVILMQTHSALKQLEKTLTEKLGTVILR